MLNRPTLNQLIKGQNLTLALAGAVLLAIAFPALGAQGGPLRAEFSTKIAVALTFFIQGLSLPTRQIARSAAKIKLHGFCQLCIFGVAPLLAWLGMLAIGGSLHPGIAAGFLYLGALPTTISSAIVMTSNSEGDSSSALFSTTLSNVLGIFITPLLCSLLIADVSNASLSLGQLIGKIAQLIFLPIVAGQLVRPFVRDWVAGSKTLLKRTSNAMIVFIVFAAFCQSVSNGIWQEVAPSSVLGAIALAIAFLLGFSYIVWIASALVTKDRSERIAALFCGSQKTLASGVPMASILFSSPHDAAPFSAGLVILPLMCYHPLQLLLAGLLSARFSHHPSAHASP